MAKGVAHINYRNQMTELYLHPQSFRSRKNLLNVRSLHGEASAKIIESKSLLLLHDKLIYCRTVYYFC